MARFLKNRDRVTGTVPGSLIFLGKQKMDTTHIHVLQYNNSTILEKTVNSIAEAKSLISNDLTTWINIYGLHSTQIIQETGELFAIPNLTLEDILNTDHRPRIVESEEHITLILKGLNFNVKDNKIHSDQISFVIGQNYVLTFQERVGEYFNSVRDRIRNKAGRIRNAKNDYLAYSLIDSIIDNSLVTIELLGEKIESLESKLIHPSKNIAQSLYHYKNEITYIRKNIRPHKEILFQLQKSDSSLITKPTKPYLDDLMELVNQSLESIEIYYNMVSDQLVLFNTYTNNKSTEVMKFLTILTTIFIPLTFIVGVYGTNFEYLPELKFKYGYFIMWFIMLFIAIIMFIYFKRKKWL